MVNEIKTNNIIIPPTEKDIALIRIKNKLKPLIDDTANRVYVYMNSNRNPKGKKIDIMDIAINLAWKDVLMNIRKSCNNMRFKRYKQRKEQKDEHYKTITDLEELPIMSNPIKDDFNTERD